MKVILLQDEKKLGKKGDLVEVSEGYARNYILPKKIGVEASARNLNDLKLKKANEERIAKEQLEAARALAASSCSFAILSSLAFFSFRSFRFLADASTPIFLGRI